jgi:hypothetical protein
MDLFEIGMKQREQKTLAAILLISAIFIGYIIFIPTDNADSTVSMDLTSFESLSIDEVSNTVDGFETPLERLTQLREKELECKAARLVSKEKHQQTKSKQSEALVKFLREGGDWKTLIPLFIHADIRYDMLIAARNEFEKSKLTFGFNNKSGTELLDKIKSDATSLGFLEATLINVSEDQINHYIKFPDVSPVDLGGNATYNYKAPLYSPAMVIIADATNHKPEQYIAKIKGLTFDVNAAAYAIKNTIPQQSLLQILRQTKNIGEMPVSYSHFHSLLATNLADIAIESLNLEALILLEKKGLRPSSIESWGQPIDMLLRPNRIRRELSESDQQQQAELLRYLIEQGYSANLASDSPIADEPHYFFVTKDNVHINVSESSHPKLMKLLSNASFIRREDLVAPELGELPSKIVSLFSKVENAAVNKNGLSNPCQNLEKELQDAQYLLSDDELQEKTGRVFWDGKSTSTLRELHNIDPELVRREFQRWAERASIVRGNSVHDGFPKLLHKEDKQEAIDYVTRVPLDQHSTNILLRLLTERPALVVVWNARIDPLPPVFFWEFNRITLDELQALAEVDFDFSVTDKIGQDIYSNAIMNLSDVHIDFLLSQAPPANPTYGIDALDLMLDKVYIQNYLPEYADNLIAFFTVIEPNHSARLARLKLLKPELYQQIIQLDPRMAVDDQTIPNAVIYPGRYGM